MDSTAIKGFCVGGGVIAIGLVIGIIISGISQGCVAKSSVGTISFPEEIGAVKTGDTLVVRRRNLRIDIDFYKGGPIGYDEEIYIVH